VPRGRNKKRKRNENRTGKMRTGCKWRDFPEKYVESWTSEE
jgi:transposase